MLSQVDYEGHHYQVLTAVTNNKKDDSIISKVNVFIKSNSGNLHRKRTTCEWKLLVECKGVPADLVPLKVPKQSKQVDLAEYAMANEINDEPAFN